MGHELMNDHPNIHKTRNRPVGVCFSDEFVFVNLADGRAIGIPLYFFPWLRDASDNERNAYQLYPFSVYWRKLDDGIDIIAMISGMYMKDMPRPEATIERAQAATT